MPHDYEWLKDLDDPDCPWCDTNEHIQVRSNQYGISQEPLFQCTKCGNTFKVRPTLRKEDLQE